MARLSLTFLFLLSVSLSLSLVRSVPDEDQIRWPETQSEPTFLPQLPKPESEFESTTEPLSLPEIPKPNNEERVEIPELPNSQPEEEKPQITDTVEYIVVPVHRLHRIRQFGNIRDIGFSLRLPINDQFHHHHHHHHHRQFGGFGHGFGHRFGHGFGRRFGHGFPGREDQMEVYPVMVNGGEDRKMEMPEVPHHMKELLEKRGKFFDKTDMPMPRPMEEDGGKMERAKEMMKRMRKCKHHHMEKGMHRHHEHHHEPREEPREPREEREEGGLIKQFWNLFNF